MPTSLRPLISLTSTLVIAVLSPTAGAVGPGLGNMVWSDAQVDTPVGIIHSVGASDGHGNVTMALGYLLVISSSDGGGEPTDGAIEFWDVSDPTAPTLVNKVENTDTNLLREAHGFGLAQMDGRLVLAAQAGGGVVLFELVDAAPPSGLPTATLLAYLDLPGIEEGDYSGAWWTAFQAPWLFVAGADSGLYVVDATDVLLPALIAQVPTGDLAGVVPAQVFALGNLLVVAEAQNRGMATLDISQPSAPRLIRQLDGDAGYSHLFAADGKIFTSGNIPPRIAIHQVTPTGNMSHVATFGLYFNSGGYGSYQDGYFFSGFSDQYVKIDVAAEAEVASGTSGLSDRDEDFAVVLGNLVFAGDDHGKGTALIAHQAAPDATAPTVAWLHPAADSTGLALSTRIGASFSDMIDVASLTDEAVVLTDPAANRVMVVLSAQQGLLNIAPTAPLVPNSTYHLVIEGVRDLVGNASARFEADLTTGDGSIGLAPGDVVTALVTSSVIGDSALAVFDEGVATYVDRAFVWQAGFPERFRGQPAIQTRNNDKLSVSADFMQFTLAVDAELVVLYDAGAGAVPGWLAAFSATGEQVNNDDTAYDVYTAMRSAGAVVLGGNEGGTDDSMYAVVIIPAAFDCTLSLTPALTGNVTLAAQVPDGAQVDWQIGDTALLDAGASVNVTLEPGRHAVVATVTAGPRTATCSAVQVVHRPLVPVTPRVSSALAWIATGTVATVNPDHGTVSLIDDATGTRLWETPAGTTPVSIAQAPDNALWVLDRDGAQVVILEDDGAERRRIALPRATRPSALLIAPDGTAFVSLSATGEVLRLGADGIEQARAFITPTAAGLSLHNGRLYVSRAISGDVQGEIAVVDADTLTLENTIALEFDAGPDTEASGRGVPTQLSPLAVSPDGTFAIVTGQKANIARGMFRDSLALTFETRVRAFAAFIDLGTHTEIADRRLDINDRDMVQALAMSPLGDIVFIAARGNNAMEAFDTATGRRLAQVPVGKAPIGVAVKPDGTVAVSNWLSRQLLTFDAAALFSGAANFVAPRNTVLVAQSEPLTAELLRGKQIFHDAGDRRMSKDGYISCSSCHDGGGHDGRVWDFTQAGEGLRNTISLHGRAGTGHGNVHWTANFDEIQDFENDIRNGFSGTGFLTDEQFASTSNPLGAAKAGLSADLDALAAYVSSLDAVPPSPHREPTGVLDDPARRGRAVFNTAGCAVCHAGETFTDGLRHDVGTVGVGSGQGISSPLAGVGFDTPTLKGLWHTPPYLHDGSALTLIEALQRHGEIPLLAASERDDLIAYLQQLDETSLPPEADCALADECVERAGEGEGEGEGEGDAQGPGADQASGADGCGCGAGGRDGVGVVGLALLLRLLRRRRP